MIVCKHDTAVVVLSYNGKDLHQLFFPLLLSESQGHVRCGTGRQCLY
jgi:hypothetical protein